ncbi:unnamed protein product [Dicrocoelium dendriticum]|nr:unnamed protein product [Dicrocoelium dendriticum]
MGMITTVELDEGTCFGPLPRDWMIADPAYLIAQSTVDRLTELPTVMLNPHKLSDPTRLIEWVCNLRSARYPGEQNVQLVRVPSTGQYFYQIIRRIEAGTEMFVWFRRDDLNPLVGQLLTCHNALNDWLGRDYMNNDGHRSDGYTADATENSETSVRFSCATCAAEFRFIYPYVSHCLFKCRHLRINCAPCVTTSFIYTKPARDATGPPIERIAPRMFHETDATTVTTNTHLNSTLMSQFCRPPGFAQLIPTPDAMPLVSPKLLPSQEDKARYVSMVLKTSHVTNCHRFKSIDPHIGEMSMIEGKNNENLPNSSPRKVECRPPRSYTGKQRSSNSVSNGMTSARSSVHSIKTRNPLVEQLLHAAVQRMKNPGEGLVNSTRLHISPLPTTVQNWCARCSTTFRLTSDLVQHMRTHHNSGVTTVRKRSRSNCKSALLQHASDDIEEPTGTKKCSPQSGLSIHCHTAEKPETTIATTGELGVMLTDHFTCGMCSETFRERHHLTRHMSSHN